MRSSLSGLRLRSAVILAMLASLLPQVAAAQAVGRTCVDVQIGTERYYDCLNQALARLVPSERFSAAQNAPYAATSPPAQVGVFNRAATAERMGNALGHSAFPQRPPPPVFPTPLMPGRH